MTDQTSTKQASPRVEVKQHERGFWQVLVDDTRVGVDWGRESCEGLAGELREKPDAAMSLRDYVKNTPEPAFSVWK